MWLAGIPRTHMRGSDICIVPFRRHLTNRNVTSGGSAQNNHLCCSIWFLQFLIFAREGCLPQCTKSTKRGQSAGKGVVVATREPMPFLLQICTAQLLPAQLLAQLHPIRDRPIRRRTRKRAPARSPRARGAGQPGRLRRPARWAGLFNFRSFCRPVRSS